jgi:hypothetical protein
MEEEKNGNLENSQNENDIDKDDLPEGVTPEPQSSEHMDLRTVSVPHSKWLKVYLKVSDDQGHLLDNQPLEEKVIKTCKELRAKKYLKIENPETLIRVTKELIETYAVSINAAENSSVGTLTKYRLRLGMLLIYLKWLVTKYLKMEWLDFFNENFQAQQLRSYQDYMKLAKYPNIINYAWLGKERLIQLTRVIGAPEGADPIGDYLGLFGLEFNSEEEIDYEKMKLKTDVAIFRQKLNEKNVYEIPDEKIEAMILNGVQGTTSIFDQFKLLKDMKGELIEFTDKLIAKGGMVRPDFTPEKKAENFKKTLDRFIDQAKSALNDEDYLKKLDIESINALQEKINALRDRIVQRSA